MESNRFKEITYRWPDAQSMADDLGVARRAVYKWREMDSIPAKYWQRMIELGMTDAGELINAAAQRKL